MDFRVPGMVEREFGASSTVGAGAPGSAEIAGFPAGAGEDTRRPAEATGSDLAIRPSRGRDTRRKDAASDSVDFFTPEACGNVLKRELRERYCQGHDRRVS